MSDRILAIHPHWRGYLSLDPEGGTITHEGTGHRGTYLLTGRTLAVKWDSFPEEEFMNVNGRWIQSQLVTELEALGRFRYVRAPTNIFKVERIALNIPTTNFAVDLRPDSTDMDVFHQVFVAQEYNSENLPNSARYIMDLGANIGLSTAFFAIRYPDAQIVAVEPDRDNFALLSANTRQFGRCVTTREVAVWTHDGTISLQKADSDGSDLGAWGVRTVETAARRSNQSQVACVSMRSLLGRSGFPRIDVLKVDIEGAELELFTGPVDWLANVDCVVVETHDRFRPGSDAAVREALAADFVELPGSGENLIFRRRT